MKNHLERLDKRTTLNGHGVVSNNTPLYNQKYGVTMNNSCGCGTDSYVTDLSHGVNEAAEYNFTILKGTTLDFDVVYKDASKRPVNLTGYKARCIAQYNDKTFTINATICDVRGGKIHLDMSAYETSSPISNLLTSHLSN